MTRNIKRFMALHARYLAVAPKFKLARLQAEKAGHAPLKVPEVAAMHAEIEAIYKQAHEEFGISRNYFGLVGNELTKIIKADPFGRW